MPTEVKYALITGATGGLGKAFAEELAATGYALLLTGRSEEKLYALKSALSEKHAALDCRYFAADLACSEARTRLVEWVRAQNLRLSLLVNAAGADIQKSVAEYNEEKISLQCRVNFEAAVSLCRFALELRAEHLEIVNISSVSGIYPMPYFAVYSATKAALTSFSAAFREEVKGRNVAVTAVLPGAMPTRADICAQIKGQGLWGKLAAKSPTSVARASLRAVRKNKRKVVVGFWNKLMRVSTAWLPSSLRLRFIARRWSKITKDAF